MIRKAVFFIFALVIFLLNVPSVQAYHRPHCTKQQYDYKQGPNLNRIGFWAEQKCDGEMYYMSMEAKVQYLNWQTMNWEGGARFSGGGGYHRSTNYLSPSYGFGPIPSYLGINCRRIYVTYFTEWYDFTIPGNHPSEGLREVHGWTTGECW